MLWSEQGTLGQTRHTVVPRTLIFVTSGGDVLLLRGAADKRIWPGKLNGLGGHIEPGEDVLTSAEREIAEEAGISVSDLRLRGAIHISGSGAAPGVMLFVCTARARTREVTASTEGEPVWCPLDALPKEDMVHDLPDLLARLFADRKQTALVFGAYTERPDGKMEMRFREA